jgi:hypothetical protein
VPERGNDPATHVAEDPQERMDTLIASGVSALSSREMFFDAGLAAVA